MGEEVGMDTKLELCAGNLVPVPRLRRFHAIHDGTHNTTVFKEIRINETGGNPDGTLYHIGGKDACRVRLTIIV